MVTASALLSQFAGSQNGLPQHSHAPQIKERPSVSVITRDSSLQCPSYVAKDPFSVCQALLRTGHHGIAPHGHAYQTLGVRQRGVP